MVRHFLFFTSVLVQEGERAIVLKNGRFHAVLRPGRYWFNRVMAEVTADIQGLGRGDFTSTLADDSVLRRSRGFADHITEIVTGPDEVAVIHRDGRLFTVQKPDFRTVYWTDAGPWSVERVAVGGDLAVPATLAARLANQPPELIRRCQVEPGQVGLLFVDHAFVRQLAPGSYAFWDVGRTVQVKMVDLREHQLDVPGQEILSRDRVSIRATVTARYRVTDPLLAVSTVKDYADSLYRALQHALRRSLTAKSLDEILADRISIDTADADGVRTRLAASGLEVGDITIKDVILPGEMREILNRVVTAQKEAEANAIRRREETAATRSLLNTARVIEENPIMLRLKELEALERIVEKVGTLVIHNGTQGLLRDMVTLGGSVDPDRDRRDAGSRTPRPDGA